MIATVRSRPRRQNPAYRLRTDRRRLLPPALYLSSSCQPGELLPNEHERDVGDGLPERARESPTADRLFDAVREPWVTPRRARGRDRLHAPGRIHGDGG